MGEPITPISMEPKAKSGPKFRRKEKKYTSDNRTLAEKIISQRKSATQEQDYGTDDSTDASVNANSKNDDSLLQDSETSRTNSATSLLSGYTELNNEPLEDSNQSSSPGVTSGELSRCSTFTNDTRENSPSGNDPVSKFVQEGLDKMDSVEIDVCSKTLEEMVDQTLQSLVSGGNEEPKDLLINEDLKQKILSEDFQKKLDNFLTDI